MNAACDLSLLTDRTTMDKMGHSVTSFEHYQNGMFVIPLILNLPGQSLNVRSGFNSRGTNTNMEFEVQGLALPGADPNTQIPVHGRGANSARNRRVQHRHSHVQDPNGLLCRRHSVDALLHNGVMHTNDAVDDLSIVFQPLIGFFAESSTRYIPTSLTGPITVRLTLCVHCRVGAQGERRCHWDAVQRSGRSQCSGNCHLHSIQHLRNRRHGGHGGCI